MSKTIREYAIPLLPCNSINETEEFYVALGFEVTYKQKVPNNFISLKLGEIVIQFFGLKAQKPEDNYNKKKTSQTIKKTSF